MSRPVHERLRQLETEVQQLQMLPAAAVRARGRSRARRRTAAVMAGVAVVATTGGITATRALDVSRPGPVTPGPAAGPGTGALVPACDLTLPSDPAQVRVRLADGGAPNGISGAANQLRDRRFTLVTMVEAPASGFSGSPSAGSSVDAWAGPSAGFSADPSAGSADGSLAWGSADPANGPVGATTLHYGPAAIGAAVVLRAALVDEAVMRFDPARADDVIDLTLGTGFTRLATSTEVNQALVAAGEPSAPPGC